MIGLGDGWRSPGEDLEFFETLDVVIAVTVDNAVSIQDKKPRPANHHGNAPQMEVSGALFDMPAEVRYTVFGEII
jgi:hypothetical protein